MANKPMPMTSEAIALTEKKMDMSLDEIIKMSKKNSSRGMKPRVSNKTRAFSAGGAVQRNVAKIQRFMDSRSSMRQGILAQRRSNFTGNQFPLAAEAAKKAAIAPIRNRIFKRTRLPNWNKPRVSANPLQREAVSQGEFGGAKVKPVTKQRSQTLDSLFANMKEQRMRSLSMQLGRNTQRTGRPFNGRTQQFRGAGARGGFAGARGGFNNGYKE